MSRSLNPFGSLHRVPSNRASLSPQEDTHTVPVGADRDVGDVVDAETQLRGEQLTAPTSEIPPYEAALGRNPQHVSLDCDGARIVDRLGYPRPPSSLQTVRRLLGHDHHPCSRRFDSDARWVSGERVRRQRFGVTGAAPSEKGDNPKYRKESVHGSPRVPIRVSRRCSVVNRAFVPAKCPI
jgi:hypothetical protein